MTAAEAARLAVGVLADERDDLLRAAQHALAGLECLTSDAFAMGGDREIRERLGRAVARAHGRPFCERCRVPVFGAKCAECGR
jgi:hypothetical protein